MVGNPREQGRRNPLRHLRERFFGQGRRIAVQSDSLEQQLQDPQTKCSDIVETYWGFYVRRDISPSQLDNALNFLADSVNEGTADKDLIPTIEATITRALPFHPEVNKLSEYKAAEENPTTILHLYRHLILLAKTPESIPYLLQALNSSLVVKGNEPTLNNRQVRFRTEYGYDSYGVEQHWNVYYPFADRARVRLREIMSGIADPSIRSAVEKAIKHFDASRKNGITTIANTFAPLNRR